MKLDRLSVPRRVNLTLEKRYCSIMLNIDGLYRLAVGHAARLNIELTTHRGVYVIDGSGAFTDISMGKQPIKELKLALIEFVLHEAAHSLVLGRTIYQVMSREDVEYASDRMSKRAADETEVNAAVITLLALVKLTEATPEESSFMREKIRISCLKNIVTFDAQTNFSAIFESYMEDVCIDRQAERLKQWFYSKFE